MSIVRAARYRRLARQETDPEKIRLLNSIADEAERGVLVTSEFASIKPSQPLISSSRDLQSWSIDGRH